MRGEIEPLVMSDEAEFRPPKARMALAAVAMLTALLAMAPQAGGDSCGHPHQYSGTDCLHAWWDNTPHWTTGVVDGSTLGMQNYCAKYGGKMHANVVFENGAASDPDSEVYKWSHSGKENKKFATRDVDDVYCCIESRMCYKKQVEAQGGWILLSIGKYYVERDVSTHEKRYELCQSHPDSVYCKVDPEGDAHIPLNCGDHDCTVGDCRWHFEQSPAYETCQGENGDVEPMYSISAEDGSSQTCHISATCRSYVDQRPPDETTPSDSWLYKYAGMGVSVDVWHVDDVVNCSTVNGNWERTGNHFLNVGGDAC